MVLPPLPAAQSVGPMVEPDTLALESLAAMLPLVPAARQRPAPEWVTVACLPPPMPLPPSAAALHALSPPFHSSAQVLHPPGMMPSRAAALEPLGPG